MSEAYSYHESLLHWIWNSLHFEVNELRTREGQPVFIHSPGEPNHSDGPDFNNASVTIGDLKWHGDIEIHWDERDWTRHGHSRDSRYNRVILHVVYDRMGKNPVCREDGTPIPTLRLLPYLKHSLRSFVARSHQDRKLPCSGHIPYLSTRTIESQFDKAHQLYFEQKVNDLFRFFNPDLGAGTAWKEMVIIALFDGLGISHNRKPMRKLAAGLLADRVNPEPVSESAALDAAALDSPASPYRWNHKGCRPKNHPSERIPQGVALLNQIISYPADRWLSQSPEQSWKELRTALEPGPAPGSERSSILYGTVWLPSLYLLGNLYADEALQQQAHTCWDHHKADLPGSLLLPFKKAGFPQKSYEQKLGSVYQFKTFCKPRKCQHCSVFKSLISA